MSTSCLSDFDSLVESRAFQQANLKRAERKFESVLSSWSYTRTLIKSNAKVECCLGVVKSVRRQLTLPAFTLGKPGVKYLSVKL
jgi:hypothetical protein